MTALLGPARQLLQRLVPKRARVVVATSGGPDSQALLALIAAERERLGVAGLWACGIDHGLRAEAPAELALARELATRLGVPFASRRVEVGRTGNLMAAARTARYAALESFADEVGADRIAVAHTASDQIETVLLNLTRGAGLRGAGGIRKRRGRVIRPLISTTREEIIAFLAASEIAHATDPSNHDLQRARATVRHRVVPLLRELNPRLEAAFGRFAESAQADELVLAHLADRELAPRLGPLDSLDLTGWSPRPVALATRVLRGWLARHGLTADRATATRLRALVAGRHRAISIDGRTVVAEAGRLWITGSAPFDLPLAIPGEVELRPLGLKIIAELQEIDAARWSESLAATPSEVAFTSECPHLGLRVRSWQKGDRLRPFGMDGHVKVGDLFTNAKIPRALRGFWPLVARDEEILWVVGLRRAAGLPVGRKARRAMVLRVVGALPWQPC